MLNSINGPIGESVFKPRWNNIFHNTSDNSDNDNNKNINNNYKNINNNNKNLPACAKLRAQSLK